eukprot:scaffold33699_cov31-Attheya_sp.AAC.2
MDTGLVESISRIEYLEKYGGLRSELDSLPVPEDGVTCCAGALCSSPTKPLFNHCACIYCQKNCHEECCYQRVNDGLVIPVKLQDSQRPNDLYTVCKACEKAKLNGTQCAHYYLSVNGTTVSLDPRKTCTRSRVGIYLTHKCCYCNKVVHPKYSTYIPKSFVMSCINGFTQDCKMSAFPVSPLSLCFSCKKRIHTDCVTSTRTNPRTKWKMTLAAGGHEWPGSTLQFCPACHLINNAYTQNENEFIKPYETVVEKLILCGFKRTR